MLTALAALLAGMASMAGAAQAAEPPSLTVALSPGVYDPDDSVTRNALEFAFELDPAPDASLLRVASVTLPDEVVVDLGAGFAGCTRQQVVDAACPESGRLGSGAARSVLMPGAAPLTWDLVAYAGDTPGTFWVRTTLRENPQVVSALQGSVLPQSIGPLVTVGIPYELLHPATIDNEFTALSLRLDAVGTSGRPVAGLAGCATGTIDVTGHLLDEGNDDLATVANGQATCSVGDVFECAAGAMPRLLPGAAAAVSVRCEDAAGPVALSVRRMPARGTVDGVVQPAGAASGSVRYTARTPGSDIIWLRATDGVATADVPVPITIGTPPIADPPPDPPAGPTEAEISAALRRAADARPRLKRLRKRGGFAVPFTAPAPGTLAIRWSARKRGKTVVIARGAEALDGAGEVRVRLTRAGRKLLKGRERVRISMRLRFTPDGGGAVTVTRKATLKR
ncbi:MAG: hypothetical protein ABW081_14700 [Solirubrobacteraceae bacterium]